MRLPSTEPDILCRLETLLLIYGSNKFPFQCTHCTAWVHNHADLLHCYIVLHWKRDGENFHKSFPSSLFHCLSSFSCSFDLASGFISVNYYHFICITANLLCTVSGNKPPPIFIYLVGFCRYFESPHSFLTSRPTCTCFSLYNTSVFSSIIIFSWANYGGVQTAEHKKALPTYRY